MLSFALGVLQTQNVTVALFLVPYFGNLVVANLLLFVDFASSSFSREI
ncbi:hypothetical protein SAMN05428979_4279 [Stappia sp. ES.058]|nr:hypothetical protein SAMN05428979_4279 [Stappia sp. ES.058]